MKATHKVGVLSASCPCCDDAIETVRSIVGSTGEVEVFDMHRQDVAVRARELGIERVPAVVIDGKLAECCAASGVDERMLRAAGVGSPR